MAANTIGEIQTEYWSYSTVRTAVKHMSSERTLRLRGACDNLVSALTLLANRQKGGDNPVNMVLQGLPEKRRLQSMDGLKMSIKVDNHETLTISNQEKKQVSRPVVKPRFTAELPKAVSREGADELTS